MSPAGLRGAAEEDPGNKQHCSRRNVAVTHLSKLRLMDSDGLDWQGELYKLSRACFIAVAEHPEDDGKAFVCSCMVWTSTATAQQTVCSCAYRSPMELNLSISICMRLCSETVGSANVATSDGVM